MQKIRESNFELLRIIAMFCILFYHFIGYFILPIDESAIFLKSLRFLLHVGVLLFIFISGYFTIKPTIRGGMKLLLMTIIYFVPLQFIVDAMNGAGVISLARDICVLSYGPYWFITTYLLFYLLVPVINKYIENISYIQRLYLLGSLAFINIWIGRITEGLPYLIEGKNIITFFFLYLIGNTIRNCKSYWEKIPLTRITILFIVYNITIISTYYYNQDGVIGKVVTRLCYGYNSPGLIFGALLLFLIFAKIKIKNKLINYISSSVFAVYLITDQTYIRNYILKDLVETIYTASVTTYLQIILIISFTIFVMFVCVVIDKMLSPMWKISNFISKKYTYEYFWNK